MSGDFPSLSPVSYLFSRPSWRITVGKVYQQNDKISMHAHLYPSPLFSLFLSPPPPSSCTLAHPMLCPPPTPNPLSTPSALALPPALPPLYLAAVQWAFLSVTLISSRKGGKCENFPWRLLISVGGDLRVAFGAFFSLFTGESFIINWQPSHKGIGLFLC